MAQTKIIKELRVLQIVPQIKFGGVERGVLDIHRYLQGKKINSYILCESINNELIKKSELKYIYTTEGIKFKNISHYFGLNKKLKWIIDAHKINLIHISSRAPAFIFYNLIRKQSEIKLITGYHNPYKGGLFKRYYNSFLLKGDLIIANSNFTKNYINKNFNISAKVVAIPRGIDLDYFNPKKYKSTNKNLIKKKYKIPENNIIASIPSRFAYWKGHKELIEFLNEKINVLPKNLKIIFFVNKNNQKEKELLISLCSDELSKRIITLNYTKDISDIYFISDLVISNSNKAEGFGRTIAESLAMNVVAIGSNLGGVREQLYNFDRKLLFDGSNKTSFYKALKYALNRIEMRNFNSRRYIVDNYSLKKMLDETLKNYYS